MGFSGYLLSVFFTTLAVGAAFVAAPGQNAITALSKLLWFGC